MCSCSQVKAWSEQIRIGAPKARPEYINLLKKKHKRVKLPSTVTIDSIYEKRFLSLNSVIEAVVLDAYILPGAVWNSIHFCLVFYHLKVFISNEHCFYIFIIYQKRLCYKIINHLQTCMDMQMIINCRYLCCHIPCMVEYWLLLRINMIFYFL